MASAPTAVAASTPVSWTRRRKPLMRALSCSIVASELPSAAGDSPGVFPETTSPKVTPSDANWS